MVVIFCSARTAVRAEWVRATEGCDSLPGVRFASELVNEILDDRVINMKHFLSTNPASLNGTRSAVRGVKASNQIGWFVVAVFGWVLPLAVVANDKSAPPESGPGTAQSPPDKSRYNLFNPTPTTSLREMSTDRPDKTEGPYTVDAGHFQVEMDLVNYTRDRTHASGEDWTTDSFAVGGVNFRVGLLDRLEFDVVLETYNWVRTIDRVNHTVTHQSGFGDVTTRLKFNCWGNDGGSTALALLPFVKSPTSQDNLGNDAVEGGFIIPVAVELPGGWGLGLMTRFDFMQDADGAGYHPEFVNSITLSHDIIGRLSGYAEFFSQVSTDRGSPWIGTADLGLTYGLTANLQLDAGVNIGVTRSADDVNPFVGISFRF